jgi:putative SOS response-associated peptidase YedK
MPVILSREDEELWLDQAAGADDLSTLLTAYPESGIRAITISTRVNSVANEGPDVAEPGGAGA